MLAKSTVPVEIPRVLITHPVTNEVWDITSLLLLMHELGTDNPALVAEAIFDVNYYISGEQHSAADTAKRLRAMMARISALGVAFDNIIVSPAPSDSRQMRIL